ncbi:tryptophan 2,3-dioxygenase [Maricaulis parjimensis]|uniref:tryptophan 2,3-dioxygenase n=1 Tax=Maricaulis parjimensis TaxID=144023 RepID=UPI00193A42E8|nr:tryptophan 2,3-dioxygenase [Maricaulis parjimensis]
MSDQFKSSVDVSGEDIHWDFKDAMSYGGYLGLDRLLSAQKCLTEEHDEMLFIIIHQVGELWMKLLIHEVEGGIAHLQDDEIGPALKMFARVSRTQEQLIQAWDVLATMTPADYLAFRDALGQSSGFQSFQYRTLEYRLGNKNAALSRVHADNPPAHKMVTRALELPSLWDETLRLLARKGYPIPDEAVERDWTQPYKPSQAIEDIWRDIYHDSETHWEAYELGEKLVDLEHKFQQWRFNHMKTVERIIGFRRGTGGTSGVSYLVKALDLRFFPEIWTVRTTL